MEIMELGRLTEVMLLHEQKAKGGMSVTELGMTRFVNKVPSKNRLCAYLRGLDPKLPNDISHHWAILPE